MKRPEHSPEKRKIMLALQGGGAHSAYVWGVLDRLLDEGDIEIVGVSGASGGAMIAAVLAYALSLTAKPNGDPMSDFERRKNAKQLLRKFWREVSRLGDWCMNLYRFHGSPFFKSWNIDGTPVPIMLSALSLLTSPYQQIFGPRQNPLKYAIESCIDFASLRESKAGPKLYVCATNVRTNQPKVFEKHEICTDHLLASACLPMVDRAVEIDGEFYWDGGYVSDPALAPLLEKHRRQAADLVIIGVNPIVRTSESMPPNNAWEIMDRMNEISFNASLIGEIKRIDEINDLLEVFENSPNSVREKPACRSLNRKRKIFIHYIPPHEQMAEMGVASKSNTAWPFLEALFELGNELANAWIAGRTEGGGAPLLGKSSDTNLNTLFITSQHWDSKTSPEPDKDGGHHAA